MPLWEVVEVGLLPNNVVVLINPVNCDSERCRAPDRFLLTKPNTFLHNRSASVATLRWRSGSSQNAVRNRPGFSVRLRRNPTLDKNLCELRNEDRIVIYDQNKSLARRFWRLRDSWHIKQSVAHPKITRLCACSLGRLKAEQSETPTLAALLPYASAATNQNQRACARLPASPQPLECWTKLELQCAENSVVVCTYSRS